MLTELVLCIASICYQHVPREFGIIRQELYDLVYRRAVGCEGCALCKSLEIARDCFDGLLLNLRSAIHLQNISLAFQARKNPGLICKCSPRERRRIQSLW